jgi:S1-C subfamily serine protease
VPEKFPLLKEKYGSQLNYEGNVVQSCIHCHQIGDAQKEFHRKQNSALPEQVLFPYPHPKALGLILDPKERASVLRVDEDSLAAKAGFRAGDVIEKLEGQPLLSMADVQWVLHHVSSDGGTVKANVLRDGKPAEVALELPKGWRKKDDIAWRASSWQLRRIGLGGLFLKNVSSDLRSERKLPAEGMALRVEHVGQYAPHDRAKQAGFVKNDVLVSFDGRTDLARETDLLHYTVNELKPGSKVPVEILREGKKLTLTLPVGE